MQAPELLHVEADYPIYDEFDLTRNFDRAPMDHADEDDNIVLIDPDQDPEPFARSIGSMIYYEEVEVTDIPLPKAEMKGAEAIRVLGTWIAEDLSDHRQKLIPVLVEALASNPTIWIPEVDLFGKAEDMICLDREGTLYFDHIAVDPYPNPFRGASFKRRNDGSWQIGRFNFVIITNPAIQVEAGRS